MTRTEDKIKDLTEKYLDTLKKRQVRVKSPLNHLECKVVAAATVEMQLHTLWMQSTIETLMLDFFSGDYEGLFGEDVRNMSDRHKKLYYGYFKMLAILSEISEISEGMVDINTFIFGKVARAGKTDEEKEAFNTIAKGESIAAVIRDVGLKEPIRYEGEPEFKEWQDNADLLLNLLTTFFNNNLCANPTSTPVKELYSDITQALNKFFKIDTKRRQINALEYLKNFDKILCLHS
jgi:hypothetical protein